MINYGEIDINKILNIVHCDNGDIFKTFGLIESSGNLLPHIFEKTVLFDYEYNEDKIYNNFLYLLVDNDVNVIERDFKGINIKDIPKKIYNTISTTGNYIAVNGKIGFGNFIIMNSKIKKILDDNKLNIKIDEIIIDDNLDEIIIGRKNSIDEPNIVCYTDNKNVTLQLNTPCSIDQYVKIKYNNIHGMD